MAILKRISWSLVTRDISVGSSLLVCLGGYYHQVSLYEVRAGSCEQYFNICEKEIWG